MPISIHQPLKLGEIARYWARELRGTVHEESAEEILHTLVVWVVLRELKTLPLGRQLEQEIESYYYHKDSTIYRAVGRDPAKNKILKEISPGTLLELADVMREEFLRFVDEQGFLRPTFWDPEPMRKAAGESAPLTPTANTTAARKPRARARHAKLDNLIQERIAAGTPPVKGSAFYNEARDICGGWEDKQKRTAAQYWDDKTIGRRIDALAVNLDKLDN
jgi:hypothetical protein